MPYEEIELVEVPQSSEKKKFRASRDHIQLSGGRNFNKFDLLVRHRALCNTSEL
jgi:hypothetical protein